MLSMTALVLVLLLALLLIGYIGATLRQQHRDKRKVTFILHKRHELRDLRSIANDHDAIWGNRNRRSSN